ncbi:MAG: alpha/beta hydrolase [Betaproteobacteria bacterium]|nr:alpha/beta hydrolase [Betaproteobacteria bacterium]
MVFISGIALDHLPWTLFQVPAFIAAGYQCLVFDNRDAGQTDESPVDSYDIAQLVKDTNGLLGQLGLGRFHLVGSSMGGLIAQEIALDHAERVRSLTLASTFPKANPYLATVFATLNAAQRSLTQGEFLQALGLQAFTNQFYANQQAAQAWLSGAPSHPRPQSPAAYLRQANAGANHDTLARLHDITIPTHVVVGENDVVTPPSQSRVLAEYIPGARLTVIPGAGHAVAMENAAEFNRAVMSFLAQH